MKTFYLLILISLNISAFDAQRQQQAPPSDGGAAAIVQPKRKQELQIPYVNEATSPIGVLNNSEFIESVLPFCFKVDDSTPLTLYNSLDEILNYVSISKNFTSIIRQFIKDNKGKINIEVTDILGQTALHFAAAYKNYNVAKLLIALGADVNATTYARVPHTERFVHLPTLDKFIGKINREALQILDDPSHIFFKLISFAPIHFAILNNDVNMTNLFVKSGFMRPEATAAMIIYRRQDNFSDAMFNFRYLLEENQAIKEIFDDYYDKYRDMNFFKSLDFLRKKASIVDFCNANLFMLVYSQEYLDQYRKELLEKESQT